MGGRAADEPEGRRLVERVHELARGRDLRVLTGAEVAGWYEEGVLAVTTGDDLLLAEPAAVVLASGVHERVLPFVGGDLPGVLTAGRRAVCCAAAPCAAARAGRHRPPARRLRAGGRAHLRRGRTLGAVAHLRAGVREPTGLLSPPRARLRPSSTACGT